jgi:hypothetical protein
VVRVVRPTAREDLVTHARYVLSGWSIALVTLGAYAWRTVARGRRLAVHVPEHERRWTGGGQEHTNG